MSRWRQLQRELIQKAVRGEKLGIVTEDIHSGRVYGTIYRKPNVSYSRGVLLAHCFSSNRYALGVLAERLVEYGFLCLSIDLPSHYQNPNPLSLSESSEAITEGVLLLKSYPGIRRVAVIGHSIGATAALFSNAGYNKQIETTVYGDWERISILMARQAAIIERASLASRESTDRQLMEVAQEIEALYVQLKTIIFSALAKGIKEHSVVTCYVFLAAPLHMRDTVPKILHMARHSIFKVLVNSYAAKRLIELNTNRPLVKEGYESGNPGKYVPEKDKSYLNIYFFKTKDTYEFFKYLLSMKEPIDFLQLIEKLAEFRRIGNAVNFFEYYQKKYIWFKPKLFVYGQKDRFLRPFVAANKASLDKYYKSCGNAQIYYGSFSHVISPDPNKHLQFMVANDDSVTEVILQFLDKHI